MGIISGLQNRVKTLTDPRYRHFYAQRRVTGMQERNAAADRLAATLPRPLQSEDASEVTQKLDQHGYVMLPPLTANQVGDMRAYFTGRMAYDSWLPDNPMFSAPDNAPPGTHVANFRHEDVIGAPHALAIANNPIILSAVGHILGAKPTISCMSAWWSIAHGEKAKEAELFHRDVDDYRFVKLFVYLTDVDETSGPHSFVEGTHKINKLTEVRRFSEDEIAREFAGKNLSFTGAAGTMFLENTYGIHRGVPPKSRNRLLFQVLYSLAAYIGGPKKPVAPYVTSQDGVSIDRYVNRIYLS
ncbi:phytanoyl-CoA dioxygenase family protein [Bradyrhizobium sp. WSM 1704]|uniref:phytanoyl-CoA dioxygenase family protein n=1 Tax=Bradyrhizobium semiaridum TaxID=2821404 RepID=UPI001CE2759C|nr:phytanoyl-CoA dioxygenase family protein [Bradyrhizobium semiaridum]MCA6121820.1 phytanoyl-CoA dioxygenase family protein [Bradyrhizobium semiaridum]